MLKHKTVNIRIVYLLMAKNIGLLHVRIRSQPKHFLTNTYATLKFETYDFQPGFLWSCPDQPSSSEPSRIRWSSSRLLLSLNCCWLPEENNFLAALDADRVTLIFRCVRVFFLLCEESHKRERCSDSSSPRFNPNRVSRCGGAVNN